MFKNIQEKYYVFIISFARIGTLFVLALFFKDTSNCGATLSVSAIGVDTAKGFIFCQKKKQQENFEWRTREGGENLSIG